MQNIPPEAKAVVLKQALADMGNVARITIPRPQYGRSRLANAPLPPVDGEFSKKTPEERAARRRQSRQECEERNRQVALQTERIAAKRAKRKADIERSRQLVKQRAAAAKNEPEPMKPEGPPPLPIKLPKKLKAIGPGSPLWPYYQHWLRGRKPSKSTLRGFTAYLARFAKVEAA
jgi:hypothetical protein